MCLWLTHRDLDDRWKPTTAKLLLYTELDGHRIVVHVDPGSPNRWRQEPYYSSIKRMSAFGIDQGAQVVVYIKDRAIVVLPNRDVDLGIVRLEDHIITKELKLPLGLPVIGKCPSCRSRTFRPKIATSGLSVRPSGHPPSSSRQRRLAYCCGVGLVVPEPVVVRVSVTVGLISVKLVFFVLTA